MVDKDMLEAIGQLMDAKLDTALLPIREDITKINITLENDIKKSIKLLIEGQKGMNEQFQKLDKVADDVEDIKQKVTALENVTRDNTTEIKQLRAIK